MPCDICYPYACDCSDRQAIKDLPKRWDRYIVPVTTDPHFLSKIKGQTDDQQTNAEESQDDQGPDDGSLAKDRFADHVYRDHFNSGFPMSEDDH